MQQNEQQQLAQRLAQARRQCNLTQSYVADHLGVSRSALSQIENGKRAVTGLELQKLAYVYCRDIQSFLVQRSGDGEPIAALFRANPDLGRQEQLADAVRKCLQVGRELAHLEKLVGVERNARALASYELPHPRTKSEAIRQGMQVAEQERARLTLGTAPIANVAELLETQGIRTAQLQLPPNVSGLMLHTEKTGILVVTSSRDPYVRRRFSAAHEFAHAVLDRERSGVVSRRGDKSLLETRANVFAAHLLVPAAGIRNQLALLGKGSHASKDGREPQLYDVVQLAHFFGTSRISVLYQLRNLRLISKSRFEELVAQEENSGSRLGQLLALPKPDERLEKHEFRHRFLGLAIEAYRREEISLGKLHDLGALVDVGRQDIDQTLRELNIDTTDGDEGGVNQAFLSA